MNTNSYGRIGTYGYVMNTVTFLACDGAPPAFLHDMFVTASYSICVDHSLRADGTKMASTGYFEFDKSRNVRLGVLPRDATDSAQMDWYDIGLPGFVWHCVGAREVGDIVTCWMPIFEEYTPEVPIHLADEPESFLWKVEINTRKKTVEQVKRFDHIGATERCATNDEYIAERPPRYAYLMMRGKEEMYNGVAKFDLVEETVVNTISYGESRFGGEAYFQPRPGASEEDDGWLMDIIYDKKTDSSELCIWDARQMDKDSPIAKVKAPHRIPYGVHAMFMTPEQLANQPPL